MKPPRDHLSEFSFTLDEVMLTRTFAEGLFTVVPSIGPGLRFTYELDEVDALNDSIEEHANRIAQGLGNAPPLEMGGDANSYRRSFANRLRALMDSRKPRCSADDLSAWLKSRYYGVVTWRRKAMFTTGERKAMFTTGERKAMFTTGERRALFAIRERKAMFTTGISRATVFQWLRAETLPKMDVLAALADYFGETIDYLMGRDETLPQRRAQAVHSATGLSEGAIEALRAAGAEDTAVASHLIERILAPCSVVTGFGQSCACPSIAETARACKAEGATAESFSRLTALADALILEYLKGGDS